MDRQLENCDGWPGGHRAWQVVTNVEGKTRKRLAGLRGAQQGKVGGEEHQGAQPLQGGASGLALKVARLSCLG